MPELNKANRQVCDVDIRVLSTMQPFLGFEDANTTTAGISGDSVYAMSKGSRKIAFSNPMEATMSIEAQVYPFKLFSMFSDGVIDSTAVYAVHKVLTANKAGAIDISVTGATGENPTIVTGTVFVFAEGYYGDEAHKIEGTFASGTFTATTTTDIAIGQKLEVGFVVNRNAGVKKISFNNSRIPQDYYITMNTVDKDEEGVLTPFMMVAYKATIQRTFEISLASEGDPATVTLTFDLMEDKDGNILDMIEITDDVTVSTGSMTMYVSNTAVTLSQSQAASDIAIHNAVGNVTATVKDSQNSDYAKIHAYVSGDNDTVIITTDSDAVAGTYTVKLTDSKTGTAQTATITVTVPA